MHCATQAICPISKPDIYWRLIIQRSLRWALFRYNLVQCGVNGATPRRGYRGAAISFDCKIVGGKLLLDLIVDMRRSNAPLAFVVVDFAETLP